MNPRFTTAQRAMRAVVGRTRAHAATTATTTCQPTTAQQLLRARHDPRRSNDSHVAHDARGLRNPNNPRRWPRLRIGMTACLVVCGAPALAAEPASNSVVVTGNPLGRDSLSQPSAVLAGEGLALRRSGTLGDTLDGLAGVSATGFGPQASRPIIRGLDGDRIRLLDNGGASADASNLSFDHAVAIDPLVIERVEVLRGPAALLYGGNATGGVVNTLDNRIPRFALTQLGGRAELRLGGAAADRAASALVEGGAGGLNWHVDAGQRRSSDLRTPRFSPLADGVAQPEAKRVANSAGRSESAAVGGSWADDRGFIGLALDGYRNHYGVTVEPDVTIRMRRERLALAGERRQLDGPLGQLFSQVEFQASSTRYQHQELEGDGAVGTTFKSRGQDLRLQLRQVAVGPWQGVVGLQSERLDFSALGEEAFVPDTRSRSTALFALQELQAGPATLSAGLRLERSRVSSDGDDAGSTEARFGAPDQRRFSPRNLLLGLSLPLGSGWTATTTAGSTQRAPAYYELYANGLHVATGAFEIGDPMLGVERSRHAEAGLAWQDSDRRSSARLQLWHTRFANYIALMATLPPPVPDMTSSAARRPSEADAADAPVYRFMAVPATLRGLELEGRHRLLQAGWTLDGTATLDLVRGVQRDTGEPLPRLAPWRTTLGLVAGLDSWQLGGQVRHLGAQNRVPAGETPTDGATLVDLWAGWQTRLPGGSSLQWGLKLANLGNALAYNASAMPTARWLAPAGGRSLSGTLRLTF